jgi:hypothetical protein
MAGRPSVTSCLAMPDQGLARRALGCAGHVLPKGRSALSESDSIHSGHVRRGGTARDDGSQLSEPEQGTPGGGRRQHPPTIMQDTRATDSNCVP